MSRPIARAAFIACALSMSGILDIGPGAAAAVPVTRYVDCARPVSGNGTFEEPFNTLYDAQLASSAYDTIQINRGPCDAQYLFISNLITIQGHPALPHAELTSSRPLQIYGPNELTLRHLRFVPTATSPYLSAENGALVLLEDVRDFVLSAGDGDPQYFIRHSRNVTLKGGLGGRSLRADVESTNELSVTGAYSGGVASVQVRDSQITNLDMSNHGYWAILIERSVIRSGNSLIDQWWYDQPVSLTIRDSAILDSQIVLSRNSGCCTSWNYPTAVVLERNTFVDSSFELRLANQASVQNPYGWLQDLLVQNNLFVRSGVKASLNQRPEALTDGEASLRIRHNTFVDSPFAVNILATGDMPGPQVLPDWSAEVSNNIIVRGAGSIRVENDLDPLFTLISSRIENNDIFNSPAPFASEPAVIQGNIAGDPSFREAVTGDYYLRRNSPALDAAAPIANPPADDIRGMVRPQDGDGDGVAVADMGAFEAPPGPDADLDGFPQSQDCDDARSEVHPSAVELPGNLLDENCDAALSCSPSAAWASHAQFVTCVTQAATALQGAGLITVEQMTALVRDAEQSAVGGRGGRPDRRELTTAGP